MSRFGILGPLEVRSAGGELVAVGGPRPRSLLALLLLEAGRVVSVDRLIDAIYGEAPPAGAGNALQSQVSRLRGKLGGLIELVPGGYRAAVEPDEVDAHRFARLAGSGRQALAAGDHALAGAELREALGLWRGPALADVAEAPFAAGQVARLEEARVAATEDLAEASLALGEHAELVASLTELIAAYPLRERLRGQLMRALYGVGRAADALAVFEDGRRLLADELGADPSPELSAVHLEILRAEGPARRGLPAQLTSFVGRQGDLARVAELLGSARLVTLVGPGGAGKTRLAIEAAGRAGAEVSFVDLSAVDDGVAGAVMGALGLRESGLLPASGGQPALADRLVAALAERTMLLVLDNCEQVIAEAAGLVHRLLAGCPGLRVLATSREPLGITGEMLHPLASLETEAAVRLFADRARAVRPDFVADERVRRVCVELDGLPLAIELAAARLRTLTMDELESRLDDRFGLLSRGSRTAPARHQTLRAVVEWSWSLLDADEQTLARRFAVFAGATAEAVTEVCGLAEEVLAGLVDKSLVDVSGGRYRMLDTIRAFCHERLAESGEEAKLRRAHAEYFLSVGVQADPHLRAGEQLDWLAALSAEHGNLMAALRWAMSADRELALDLFMALSWYWFLRGVRGEIAPLAEELVGRVEPEGEEYALCVLWAASGREVDEALAAHVRRATAIMEAIQASARQPFALVAWALFAGPPPGFDLIAATRAMLADNPDPWFEGLMRFGLGFTVLYTGGELADAEHEAAVSLVRFQQTGDRWGLAQAYDAMATFADIRGDSSAAIDLTDQALDVMGQLGAIEELADLRCRRGERLLRAGDVAAARVDFERAVDLARRAGMPTALATALAGLGEIARRRGDLAEARRLHEAALSKSTMDWVNVGARVEVLAGLGRVAEDEGKLDEAGSLYREAIGLAMDSRNPAAAEEATAGLARVDGQEP